MASRPEGPQIPKTDLFYTVNDTKFTTEEIMNRLEGRGNDSHKIITSAFLAEYMVKEQKTCRSALADKASLEQRVGIFDTHIKGLSAFIESLCKKDQTVEELKKIAGELTQKRAELEAKKDAPKELSTSTDTKEVKKEKEANSKSEETASTNKADKKEKNSKSSSRDASKLTERKGSLRSISRPVSVDPDFEAETRCIDVKLAIISQFEPLYASMEESKEKLKQVEAENAEKVKGFEAQIEEKTQELENLRKELEESKAQGGESLKAAGEEKNTLEERLKRLSGELEKLKKNLEEVEQQLDRKGLELEEKQKEANQLEGALKVNEELKKEITTLESLAQGLGTSVQDGKEKIQKLEEQLRESELKCNTLQKKVEEAGRKEGEVDAATLEKAEKEREEALKNLELVAAKEKELKGLRQEYEEFKASSAQEKQKLRGELQKAQEELVSSKESFNVEQQQGAEKTANVQKQLEEANTRNEQLQKELTALRAKDKAALDGLGDGAAGKVDAPGHRRNRSLDLGVSGKEKTGGAKKLLEEKKPQQEINADQLQEIAKLFFGEATIPEAFDVEALKGKIQELKDNKTTAEQELVQANQRGAQAGQARDAAVLQQNNLQNQLTAANEANQHFA
ncbi:MAG: hypothetical protein KDK76_07325, partial [Chlamydiia bacterium]|nr:hypothetical protein [Chlamydiia bacterium]